LTLHKFVTYLFTYTPTHLLGPTWGERRQTAHLPFWGQWASRWTYAMPDLQSPSQPHSTVTAAWPVLLSYPTEYRRLNWPEWLVTYQDGTHEWSPISLPTGLHVQ